MERARKRRMVLQESNAPHCKERPSSCAGRKRVILHPVLGGTASGLDRRSKPFFLFPKLWGHCFKIQGLKDLADFDLVLAARNRIRATLDPFDRLFFRIYLKHPEPGDQFSELWERTVDDGLFVGGEFDARPLRARL